MVFRVVGAYNRHIRISHIEKVIGNKRTEAIDMTRFYAPSKTWPLGHPKKARQEFAIIAPTNASTWKLRIRVWCEDPHNPGPFQRFKDLPTMWRAARNAVSPVSTACWYAWSSFYGKASQVLESDLITNSTPNRSKP